MQHNRKLVTLINKKMKTKSGRKSPWKKRSRQIPTSSGFSPEPDQAVCSTAPVLRDREPVYLSLCIMLLSSTKTPRKTLLKGLGHGTCTLFVAVIIYAFYILLFNLTSSNASRLRVWLLLNSINGFAFDEFGSS